MNSKPRLVLITDLAPHSAHSSIDGIYKNALQDKFEIFIVYAGKEIKQASLEHNNEIFVPYRARRHGMIKTLESFVDLSTVEHIVVRNLFNVLSQVLKSQNNYKFKVGFWESFPHSYRRIHEAKQEQKSVLRKTIEYKIKTRREDNLIERCDYFFPITNTFKKTFRDKSQTPWLAVQMGFDFSMAANSSKIGNNDTIKLVYIGTIDPLRKLDEVIKGLIDCQKDFELHIYTKSQNEAVDTIKALPDPRIIFHDPLPRAELLQEIASYDIGISFSPRSDLYDVSSPTKSFEYSAMGLAVMINDLPEHVEVYSQDAAFYCAFDRQSVTTALDEILDLGAGKIAEVARNGFMSVKEKRNYQVTGDLIHQFINKLSD